MKTCLVDAGVCIRRKVGSQTPRDWESEAPSPHEDFAVSTRLLGEVLEASPANRSSRATWDRRRGWRQFGPLAEVKEGFNRATGLLLDLLVQLMSFRYMSDLQDIASSCGSLVKALQQAEDQALVDSKEYKMPELVKQIRLITQQFDGNSKSVAVSTSAPAPSLLNSLTSHGTDVPDADGERERHFVSFSVPKTWTSDGLGGAFRSAGKVFNHSGTLNSSHRLIVASADLLHEEGDEPWLSLQSPASNLWKDIVTFCSSASGNTDFVMLFDGRMRQIRRTNESWLS